ncbi:MAG: hypothetical protein F6K47_33360, partial [Symploca sp. SIO2E6]|nr:hypothetical protein [Symploca sp. SIO2E6]
NMPQIPAKFSNIFLFHPSETLRAGMEKKYNAEIELVENLPLFQVKMGNWELGIGN